MTVYVRKTNAGWQVQAETRNGNSEWPIQYDNGHIAYDHPEQLTKTEKRDVGRTYKAMARDLSKWAIWEWTMASGGGDGSHESFERRCRFQLVRLCKGPWPTREFCNVAKRLGYWDYTRWGSGGFVKDGTLIGGHFAKNGDCLICYPRGIHPWGEMV